MTQPPQDELSPLEKQGALIQDLGRALLPSLDLAESWSQVRADFIPDGQGWAGRIVITDLDGTVGGGDARFAADSQITLLLDGLQQATAEQGQPMLSVRLDAERTGENRDRIALDSTMNDDQDPGSFDGIGGIDAEVARRFTERFGAEAAPPWMRALLEES